MDETTPTCVGVVDCLRRFVVFWLNDRGPKFIPVYQVYTPLGRFFFGYDRKNIQEKEARNLIRQMARFKSSMSNYAGSILPLILQVTTGMYFHSVAIQGV